jgi:DNA-binding NarL/FixJ family response regulator
VTIRILVVDDQCLLRESLIGLLNAEPGFAVVGGCGSTAEALDALGATPIQLVLLNDDAGETACEFVAEARRRGFEGGVLIITGGMTAENMRRALAEGCAGIFMKHSLPYQLFDAIRKAVSGELWLDSRAVRILAHRGAPPSMRDLSFREQAVLAEVIEGRSSKQISRSLQTSETCVKSALQRIFHKTGVRTRSQLVRLALDSKLHQAA